MDFLEDDLNTVLGRIARPGSAVLPNGSWDQLATLTCHRSPELFDVAAFRRFQTRLFELTGIQISVVGGAYGCIQLIVKVKKTHTPEYSTLELDLSAQIPEGRSDDAAKLLAVLMASSPELRSLATEAGIDRVQIRDSSVNTRTGDLTPFGSGCEREPYLQFNSTTVAGNVGQIGDGNRQIDPQIGAGSTRKSDDDTRDRPDL